VRRVLAASIATLCLYTAGAALAGAQPTATGRPLPRTLVASDFPLAFDALVGAGDLAGALLVAQKAVRIWPRDIAWRRRLIQVAQWSAHPEIAAQQWSALFLDGDRSQETLDGILNTAELLPDPALALKAWAFKVRASVPTDAQWSAIYNLYEENAQPVQGADFFEAQYARIAQPLLLELAARLAQNAGDDARALRLSLQRCALQPIPTPFVLRTAELLVRAERQTQALELLRQQAPEVSRDDVAFWRAMSVLGWALHADSDALQALQHYVYADTSTPNDWTHLIDLLGKGQTTASTQTEQLARLATLAQQAYERFHTSEQYLEALQIDADLGALQAQSELLAHMDDAARAMLEQDTRFLLLRSHFYELRQQPDRAREDVLRAEALAPDNPEVVLAGIWLRLNQSRTDELPLLLKRNAVRARKDRAFWLAYASASMVLDRPRHAAAWYRKVLQDDRNNVLVLLDYADVLQRLGSAGMAARVRRHAWMLASQRFPLGATPSAATGFLDTLRLSLLDAPGDPALRKIAALLRQPDTLAQSGPEVAGEIQVLILGWALAQEQQLQARAWIWNQYLHQAPSAPPLWARANIALALDDTRSMQQMLAHDAQALTIDNRSAMALALGDAAHAQSIDFTGLQALGNDDAAHQRLSENIAANTYYIQALGVSADLGGAQISSSAVQARVVATPRWELVLGWLQENQGSPDPQLDTLGASNASLASVDARWNTPRSTGEASVYARSEALGDRTAAHLANDWPLTQQLSVQLGLDYQVDSDLSVPMQLAGYEHGVTSGLKWQWSSRDDFQLTPKYQQYYTQYGDYLGDGQIVEAQWGHRFRTAYPDWNARVFVIRSDLSASGSISAGSQSQLPASLQSDIAAGLDPVGYFIPPSNTLSGACIGMGQNMGEKHAHNAYQRALRPFGEFCTSNSDVYGTGYSSILGVAGALEGEDYFLLEWQNSSAFDNAGDETRQFSVLYRHYL